MTQMMAYMANPPPRARSPRAVLFRARMVLVSIALVAAVLLIVVASWPLKLLVVLAFVRGLFAADIVALRNVARAKRSEHLTSAHPAGVSETPHTSGVVRHDTNRRSRSIRVSRVTGGASHGGSTRAARALNSSRPDAWVGARTSSVGVDLSFEDDDRNAGSWP